MSNELPLKDEVVEISKEADEYVKLAERYIREGNFYKANDAIDEAIWHEPNEGKLRYIKGMCLVEVGDQERAVEAFERAILLSYNTNRVHISRIKSLIHLGRYEDAIINCDTVLELDEKHLQVLNLKAVALEHLGKKEEAGSYFEKILEVSPGQPSALYNLSKQGNLDEKFAEWCSPSHAVHQKKELNWSDLSYLWFASGRVSASQGEYDQAFEFYKRGNDAVKEHHRFNWEVVQKRTDDHIDAFNREVFERFYGYGLSTSRPIFIVGMPRSGTTLIEQMISSHLEVQAAGEITYISRIEQQLVQMSQANGSSYPLNVSLIHPEGFQNFADLYLSFVGQISSHADKKFTDKLPTNFLNLGLIRLMFPNARIIHMKRDPIDTCLSCYFIRFADTKSLSFAFDLKSLGFFYKEYLRLMEHWQKVLPGGMIEVQYEELVGDNEAVLRRVLQFLGLDWDDACLEFYNNDRGVATASRHQVRKPLYTSSIKRWKPYERHLQPLIEMLGNELVVTKAANA